VSGGHTPHIRRIGEEKRACDPRKGKARRWVVERTLGWLSKVPSVLVRYDKHWKTTSLLQLACACYVPLGSIDFRRLIGSEIV